MRGVTYTIRSSLYVAVTNRCCTTSLIASRGPGLSMPTSFHPLPADVEPSVGEVLDNVTGRLSSSRETPFQEIVFAGVGEPLLRWPIVGEVVRSLRSHHAQLLQLPRSTEIAEEEQVQPRGSAACTKPAEGAVPEESNYMPLRLVTNGLWPVASQAVVTPVPRSHSEGPGMSTRGVEVNGGRTGHESGFGFLYEGGADDAGALAAEIAELFDAVSVALNTADPLQYDQIMEPSIKGLRPGSAHAIVCSFVRECAARGLRTECTVVNRDDVDVTSARELATKLGACCRARPYLP